MKKADMLKYLNKRIADVNDNILKNLSGIDEYGAIIPTDKIKQREDLEKGQQEVMALNAIIELVERKEK